MAAAYWMFDGHPRKFREILSRRKKKKGEQDMAAGAVLGDDGLHRLHIAYRPHAHVRASPVVVHPFLANCGGLAQDQCLMSVVLPLLPVPVLAPDRL